MFRSQSTISVWFLAGGRTVRNTLPCVDQLLFHRHKLNVHRRESLDLLARGREAPGIRINPENDQAIGVLVGGDQVTAGRIRIPGASRPDRKSTRLNSSHLVI